MCEIPIYGSRDNRLIVFNYRCEKCNRLHEMCTVDIENLMNEQCVCGAVYRFEYDKKTDQFRMFYKEDAG